MDVFLPASGQGMKACHLTSIGTFAFWTTQGTGDMSVISTNKAF